MDSTATVGREPADGLRRVASVSLSFWLRTAALFLLAWSLVTILTQSGSRSRETIFFQRDVLWLLADGIVLAALSIRPPPAMLSAARLESWSRSRWSGPAIASAAAVAGLIGSRIVFHGFAFTQDEMLARFDATIFRHGMTLAPLPESWRPYWGGFQASALQPSFILAVDGHSAWVSTYLPGNAAIHAVLDDLFGFDLASAVLAAIAVCAGGSVARTLWPARPDAALVTMLLLATSSQFLLNAATPFATTAHLALNLVWLALFLRGGVVRHAGAIAVAGLACGLHQIVFHPLFAAPFVLQLWMRRRWRLAIVYTAAYAAIGLFWIFYWQLMLAANGLHGLGRAGHGMTPFLGEIVDLLRHFSWSGIDLMAKNVTRFLAWQNPIVIPLALLGLVSIRRLDSPLAALVAGLVLTTAAMFVLLPLQAFGWGYRYLHGLIGSLCLLAAGGWVLIVPMGFGRDSGEGRASARASLGLASLFSIAVLLPARALEVEAWVSPYAKAERAIQAAPTDLVLIDTNGIGFGALLIRNDPFLRNRPLVMNLSALSAADLSRLCRAYTISSFDEHDAEAFGLMKMDRVPEPATAGALRSPSCGVPLSTRPDP